MTAYEAHAVTLHVEVEFRVARPDDLPKLEWYGQYTHFRTMFRRTYREQLAGNRLMLVADCNGFPIGQIFMQLHRKDSSNDGHRADDLERTYFYSLRVMEMFRGHGIGSRLIETAEQIALAKGYRSASIAAAKDNPRARRLYERMGYRVFMDDPGRWSYVDHEGRVRHVHEPCWVLEKNLEMR